jgi:PAS domain S-box-containing protein
MRDGDMIVTKTDEKGWITYANSLFEKIAEYGAGELNGTPHSIIRSSAMPRCVFKLLWDRLQAGHEVFAYVVNKTKKGNHYWVFAHVTPSYDESGKLCGYHSNRRKPQEAALKIIKETYGLLLAEEKKHSNRKEGLAASTALLGEILNEKGIDYDEFILSI